MNDTITGLNYRKAQFLTSAPTIAHCPAPVGAEVAFAGRSNAGKSSAINTLTEQKKLARTSKTPGRTQLINYFALDDKHSLVDLPGYGYAKVSIKVKQEWQRHLEEYLRYRETLRGLVLLMDIRHPMQEFDQGMLKWACSSELPVHVLLTKADKLKKGPAQSTLLKVTKEVAPWEGDISVQLFSALKKQGVGELKTTLDKWLLG